DRLYTSAPTDPRRRAAQTTCYDIFRALARMMAPILTFTSEEAWRYVPGARAESVHLERFPEVPVEWLDDTLDAEWSRLRAVRRRSPRSSTRARRSRVSSSGSIAPAAASASAAGCGRSGSARARRIPASASAACPS